jgi:nitrite reductase (NO-forming)
MTPSQPPTSTMPGMTMGQGDMHAPVVITLRSGIAGGRMVYIGVGGDIDEQVNPTLQVHEGETVQINLINGEGAEHDIVLDQYAARSGRVHAKGASTSLVLTADKTGEFIYFCTIPGHREAGMEGRVRVLPGARTAPPSVAQDIARDPTDLSAPLRGRLPQVVRVGRYTLVDHALSRLGRGLVGFLQVDGPRDDEIMHEGTTTTPVTSR